MKKKIPINKERQQINLMLVISTAAVLVVALVIANAIDIIFSKLGLISMTTEEYTGWWIVLSVGAASVIIGLFLSYLLCKMILRPVDIVMDGIDKLSAGKFSTRIDLSGYKGMKRFEDGFNAMATELENTEILRSSFVNDFSHELKTPIVSLVGLIGLLKNENLSKDKRADYLNIIEAEANRLSDMTSNALYLSKIETQSILSEKTKYNLSEQIRTSVLLLEKKWTKKNLSLSLDFDEYEIFANEDMMKQVFINLIDNAIKFSYQGGELRIGVSESTEYLFVDIENRGDPIPEEDYELVFTKFYQCDKSRSTDGNGIGLSIVKRIVTLHGGDIGVSCGDGVTRFSLTLPKQ